MTALYILPGLLRPTAAVCFRGGRVASFQVKVCRFDASG